MTEARTLNQLFQEYKEKKLILNWRDYWFLQWQAQIEKYQQLGFFLIRITKNSKKPLGGFKWGDGVKLSNEEILAHLKDGGNFAVVAGYSDPPLIILDIDVHLVGDYLLDKTLTQITPRGFGIFLRGKYDGDLMDKLRTKYPFFDTPRVDILYSLVPLSVSCLGESKGKHICEKHDYRVREWVCNKPMINFKEYCEMVL